MTTLSTALPLPPLHEILAATRVVALPMRVPFRGVTVRETALIQGPAGWGEFAPFIEYKVPESAAWLACALEAAWLPYPKPLRTEIPLNATVPAVSAQAVEGVLAGYRGQIHEVKIKVAAAGLPFDESLAADLARVAAVRELLPRARLKVDANCGWSEDQAVTALTQLAAYDLIYAEQPTPGIESLARVRERLRDAGEPLLIAADEAVRKSDDPLRVARAAAADVLIIKAAPLGGVRRALTIIEQAGLPAVVSSALESSVGIRTGAALAAALPKLPYGCGLGTVSLMGQDVAACPLVAHNGVLPVRDVEPDPALLGDLHASPDRTAWWHRRITDCYRHLSGE
ncbi:o-succinylbenzoate synthase [Rothia nasimurium]|uniref:o-succinylbenzoate synthase n=1 Tax=Rothia nasimurium TaxID=85336 RepID=UPI0015D89E9C|nr:o-succinylbenzoate synthase [Rothia nasimurium]